MDLKELFYQVAQWRSDTFPQSTPQSTFTHLLREVKELSQNISDGEEMADVILTIIGLADLQGIDLAWEIFNKFEINKNRRWGPPDSEGIIEHVR